MKNPDAWDLFVANCHQISSAHELKKFFELTLTPAECEKIAARYMILKHLIHNDLTQREIAAMLKVSIFNVTRGANQLKSTPREVQNLVMQSDD